MTIRKYGDTVYALETVSESDRHTIISLKEFNSDVSLLTVYSRKQLHRG